MAQLANTNGTKTGGRKITLQMQKDAVAWAREKITTGELARRFGIDKRLTTLVFYRAASSLREAVKEGLLK